MVELPHAYASALRRHLERPCVAKKARSDPTLIFAANTAEAALRSFHTMPLRSWVCVRSLAAKEKPAAFFKVVVASAIKLCSLFEVRLFLIWVQQQHTSRFPVAEVRVYKLGASTSGIARFWPISLSKLDVEKVTE
ncbi:hypothetical protein D3C76_154960 [compost metagenome]